MIGVRIFVGAILAMGWVWILFMALMLGYDAQQKTMVYKAHHVERAR